MASASKRCTIAILNYNGVGWLEKFLPTVEQHSGEAEILVYDNASTDRSVAYVKESHPHVRLQVGDENLGFCRGYNVAFAFIETPYAVLLNSDVEVTENWLEPLLDVLEKDMSTAAVQPKIKSYHKRDFFEYAGAAGGYLDRFGYPFCRGRVFDTVEQDVGQYDNDRPVFWASGACMALRTSLFKELGGFDERFFAHMEEIDWCWRAQRAGYIIRFAHQSTVYHVGGGTLGYDSPRKLFLNYRNNLLMLDNNLAGTSKYWTLGCRLVLDGASALYLFMKGNRQAIGVILKAHFAFYGLMGKKPQTSSINKVKRSRLSIVYHYYILRQKTFSKLGL